LGPVFGGHDPGVCAWAVHAVALAQTGRAREASASMQRAIEIAGTLNHPNSLCHALQNASVVAQLNGEHAALEEIVQRMLELAERYNLPPQRAHAKFMTAWLRTRRGEIDAATMAEEVSRPMAMGPLYRYYAALLAETCHSAGLYDHALDTVDSALASVTERGVGLAVPELHRVRALCLDCRRAGDPEARRSMDEAIAIARLQGASIFERKAREGLETLAPS
ncbi:MAG TPA: hypothetical protein VN598_16070, partial [Usitatibacter sp.]|nr:hypothetical protein [Usitatibacter sp.]